MKCLSLQVFEETNFAFLESICILEKHTFPGLE